MDTIVIGPLFFGYAKEIVRVLNTRGRDAVFYDDRPAADMLTKILVRLAPSLVKRKSDAYFDRVTEEARNHNVRDVLVIKAEALSVEAIKRMRAALPDARFTLYYWDSYDNLPKDAPAKVGLFDRAFSFDLQDTKTDTRLTYRPLFYFDDYAEPRNLEQDIDVLFIGTAHSDRVTVLERITRAIPPSYAFKKLLYVRSGLLHKILRTVNPVYRRIPAADFIFQSIPKNEVQDLVARAKVVIDVERTVQTGLTIRTIEMLAASRKTITTNPKVLEADFYNPQNQLYVDRLDPVIDPEFLESPWLPVEEAVLKRYRLSTWIDEVLLD